MHVVRRPEELQSALARSAREATAYFGRPEVFLERYIDRAHHVEAQVIADTHGNVFFLGERDCSVQRRYQKLIEETPSPVVNDELRSRIGEAAMALAKEAAYVNVGTVEGIVDEDGAFYFLEMNTRLQVEHTVTEMVTGLDLVALQIAVALGDKLELSDVVAHGHAIQCRINAEDPARNFLPGPGRVTRYRAPSGPFVRVDSFVEAGREIPSDYDSMFAKLIVAAQSRENAIGRMLRALDEFRVDGVPTTIPIHRWILQTRAFRKSTHTTTWLEKALRDAELELPADGARQTPSEAKQPVPAELLIEVDGRRVPVRIFDQRRDSAPRPPSRLAAHRDQAVHSVVTAQMQGTVLRVLVEIGQEIQAGDVICILEAMKMENAIPAPREGRISELPVREGQVVQAGDTLAVID
jgi:acetyl-CoA/propionyl-CoA carboxylase, biotin carboxylase, biotin carboxyl carrier protein